MPFENEKKMFLAKTDKSKKGSLDERIIPLFNIINQHPDYHTTSSCSGRVYFWTGSGKKNETIWVKVSHDSITTSFFDFPPQKDIVWLRQEAFILHVACRDIAAAVQLLNLARPLFKKSCLLSIRNKIIVEIHGTEILEMPYSKDGVVLYKGDMEWLVNYINKKLDRISKSIILFTKKMELLN